MVRLLTRHGIRGLLAQVRAFHSRERNRSQHTVVSELSRTHTFVPEAVIPTATAFPYRTGDVTFEFELTVTGAAPAGDALVVGSVATQVKVTVSGADLTLFVGTPGVGGVAILYMGAVPAEGNYRIAVAARAGSGEARLWVDGRLLIRGTAASGSFPDGWADAADGAYGVGLTDCSVTSLLSVYMKQVPRHFHESLYA